MRSLGKDNAEVLAAFVVQPDAGLMDPVPAVHHCRGALGQDHPHRRRSGTTLRQQTQRPVGAIDLPQRSAIGKQLIQPRTEGGWQLRRGMQLGELFAPIGCQSAAGDGQPTIEPGGAGGRHIGEGQTRCRQRHLPLQCQHHRSGAGRQLNRPEMFPLTGARFRTPPSRGRNVESHCAAPVAQSHLHLAPAGPAILDVGREGQLLAGDSRCGQNAGFASRPQPADVKQTVIAGLRMAIIQLRIRRSQTRKLFRSQGDIRGSEDANRFHLHMGGQKAHARHVKPLASLVRCQSLPAVQLQIGGAGGSEPHLNSVIVVRPMQHRI